MDSNQVYIIAEIGLNHDGNVQIAHRLIDIAKVAGCNAVKFQYFTKEEIGKDLYNKIRKYRLTPRQLIGLKSYCSKKNIDFLCSAFGSKSLNFLAKVLKLKILKIPSGKVTDIDYLEKAAKLFDKFILSTGMSTLDEIDNALDILDGDYRTTILHCISSYPAPLDEMNLLAIKTLREQLNCPVGLSDHSEGILAPIVAVALGATIVEKHITLDKNAEGPDHKSSLTPLELFNLVQAIRDAESSLGNGIKEIQDCERSLLWRKSQ